MMYAKDEKTQHTLRDNWHDIVRDRRYVSIVMGDMEKIRVLWNLGLPTVSCM